MRLPTDFYKIWAFAARSWLLNLRNVFAGFEMLFWPGVAILSVGLLTRFLKLDQETVSFILIGAIPVLLELLDLHIRRHEQFALHNIIIFIFPGIPVIRLQAEDRNGSREYSAQIDGSMALVLRVP